MAPVPWLFLAKTLSCSPLMGMGSVKVGASGSGMKQRKGPMQQGSSSRQELGQYMEKQTQHNLDNPWFLFLQVSWGGERMLTLKKIKG